MTNANAGGADDADQAYVAPQDRKGVALCLSGGGYRAALFHLGALTRLNELGVLSGVDTISAVSGGSILAAHLADKVRRWPTGGEVICGWQCNVVEPFLDFTSRNIRNRPLLKRFLIPWNWFRRGTAVEALARTYQAELTGLMLTETTARPRFIFSATDMVFGVNWVFDTGTRSVGDYQAGYRHFPAWPLAKAVAASSCFPPLFDPMPLSLKPQELSGGLYDRKNRDGLVSALSLSDGGVYDNLGLEPAWKTHDTVLASDGGAVFDAERDGGLFWRLNRYASIAGRQGGAIRKRWLISSFMNRALKGTYWSVGSAAKHYDPAAIGYPEDLVDRRIADVRTDLDRFSEAEQHVLMNHGYLVADAAIRIHAPALISVKAPLVIPYGKKEMNPAWVDNALRHSSKRRLFGH